MRFPQLLSALVLACSLAACKTTNPSTTSSPDPAAGATSEDREFEGREVVVNYEAKPGEVTVCPFSGKKFEVKADSPRFEWQGKSWVFCCDGCLDKIGAEPEKYLSKYLEPSEVEAAPQAEVEATPEAAPEAE